ncbi:MAG TPA: serine/threonine-protein kinase [Tepidisphaeraceae bacterium]
MLCVSAVNIIAMPQTGQRISEYVLDQRIGAGAFGEVWRAHHHVWATQLVAVKLPTDPAYLRDLQREGLAVQGLDHPNLVRAIGFDPFADPPYLVSEFVPGVSLRQRLSEGRLMVDEAVAVMQQVLAGLTYAHGRGIVHRDLKPENVLIHQDAVREGPSHAGLVKITDFGLGQRSAPQAGSIAYSLSMDHDQAKKIVGTLDYMSPEQRAGGAVDSRTDLYACGVMLFEMVTGEKPSGTDVPSDVVSGTPAYIDDAFRRSYTRIDRRFASADEFAAALKAPLARGNSPTLNYVPAPMPVNRTACPRCRRSVGVKDQFCMHCGVQLVTTIRRCAKCRSYLDSDDQFCKHCHTESLQSVWPLDSQRG